MLLLSLETKIHEHIDGSYGRCILPTGMYTSEKMETKENINDGQPEPSSIDNETPSGQITSKKSSSKLNILKNKKP